MTGIPIRVHICNLFLLDRNIFSSNKKVAGVIQTRNFNFHKENSLKRSLERQEEMIDRGIDGQFRRTALFPHIPALQAHSLCQNVTFFCLFSTAGTLVDNSLRGIHSTPSIHSESFLRSSSTHSISVLTLPNIYTWYYFQQCRAA